MKKLLSDMKHVFRFTVHCQVSSRGWRTVTILLALLCFLLPAGIMAGVAAAQRDHSGAEPEEPGMELPEGPGETSREWTCGAKAVLVNDESPSPLEDWSFLNEMRPETWNAMDYGVKTADDQTLLVHVVYEDGAYRAEVTRPAGSRLTEEDAENYRIFLQFAFTDVLARKAGLTEEQYAAPTRGVTVISEEAEGGDDPLKDLRDIIGMVVPYVILMLLYFLILFYGQGVANSVLLEKSSKLMDFFLVSVEPVAMVMGKVLALVSVGVGQLLLWGVCLYGGFAVGTLAADTLDPHNTLMTAVLFHSLSATKGLFSLGAILLSLGMILGGFLLYCALAAIGGSLASKQEELGTTNSIFTMTLVISFLCSMFAGGMDGMTSSAGWLAFVPVTAILVAPGRLLTGAMPLWQGVISLVLIVVFALVLLVAAGKIYRMMSLYKGNPPTPARLWKMLREKKNTQLT